MVILAIFFITAADSASVVMGILTTRGSQDPPKPIVVFWGLVMAGIAVVMLLLGDESALTGLQSLVIITAVPFAFVMLLIIVAWVRELRTDPHTLRQQYAETAVSNAVVDGVDRYNDDFRIHVVRTDPGEGAGAGVDSMHEDYTGWYQRTDEHGEPVGYDFETGTWADGWEPGTDATGEDGASSRSQTHAPGPAAEDDPKGDGGR